LYTCSQIRVLGGQKNNQVLNGLSSYRPQLHNDVEKIWSGSETDLRAILQWQGWVNKAKIGVEWWSWQAHHCCQLHCVSI
jgi:hypothetical protein